MVIPDIWIEAGTIKEQYDIAGLNEPHIVAKVVHYYEPVINEQYPYNCITNEPHIVAKVHYYNPTSSIINEQYPYTRITNEPHIVAKVVL